MYRSGLLLLLLALLMPMPSSAQFIGSHTSGSKFPESNNTPAQKREEGVPRFTTGSRLVVVPVVVTDSNGQPVKDLTSADFTILENGQAKKIKIYERIQASTAPVTETTPQGAYTNRNLRQETPHAINIVLLDLVNTQWKDQVYARNSMVEFLSKSVNGDALTTLLVLGRGGLHLVHDFTTDPQVLMTALRNMQMDNSEKPGLDVVGPQQAVNLAGQGAESLAKAEGELPQGGPGIAAQAIGSAGSAAAERAQLDRLFEGEVRLATMYREESLRTTLAAMQAISQAYGGLPGRKALIWATGSFPFDIADPEDASLMRSGEMLTQTLQRLSDSNIAVYPVDVKGLTGVGGLDIAANGAQTSRYMREPAGNYGTQMLLRAKSEGTMDTFASMTGGHAFYNTNDLTGAFSRAANESRFYYLLGYYLDSEDLKKIGWHKLKVEVARKGVKVHTRAGFMVAPGETKQDQEDNMAVAMFSPLEFTAVPLTVRWGEIKRVGDKYSAEFDMEVPGSAPQLGNNVTLSLDFAAQAHTPQGKTEASVGQTIEADLKDPNAFRNKGLMYKNVLTVPPGEYTFRFVVRDNVSGKMGAVSVPLKVDESVAKAAGPGQ
jgi:VWFA-related protein